MRKVAAVSLLAGWLLLGGESRASAQSQARPSWTVSFEAGASVVTEGCGTLGGAVSRRLIRGLEAGARQRTILGNLRKQIDGSLQLGWRWWISRFNLRLGGDIGVGALHGLKAVWAAALLLGPDLELGYRLGRFELRAGLSTTFYFNQIWIAAWEPRGSVAYSF